MMKFTRYIVVLVSLVVTMCGCVDESEQLTIKTSVDGNTITITGRITAFDDRLVDSRAGKTLEESYTSSMAMAVFPIEEDTLGKCISYVHRQGTNVNFTIDRAKIRDDKDDEYDNKPIAIYLFANMPDLPATMSELKDKSFSFFMEKAYKNSSIRRPQKGFPMVGSLGDNKTGGADGNTFVLIPTESVDGNTKIKLPELNGIPSDYIPIPLKALYAKFSFDISIQPEQHIPDGTTPTFTLESYVLNNVPTKVYAGADNNKDSTSVSGDAITTYVRTSVTEGGSLKFDFYLPERFVTPTTYARDYNYPLGKDGEKIKESQVLEKDRRYLQRFKPKLVADAKKATYITLNGYYLDHQNHNWEVSYDIYLGEDNYSDFNFKRNTNYVNNVVIRGLKASKDQNSTSEGYFVDHRVTIDRSLPLIINLQRETLLDAHYEVRPLRLRLVGDSGKSATVKILNEDGGTSSIPGWVRLEKSVTSGDDHITSGVSAGKRKYFTTDLVTTTLADSKSVTVSNLTSTNQTVWIYADENISTQSREAIVRVIYDNRDSLDYKIVQHGLHEITGAGNTYYIERFEEYLYNFDSEDSYGQIKEEGMPWGLNGKQLSNKHTSFDTDRAGTDWKNDYTSKYPLPYYDFYIKKHDSFAESNGGTVREYPGLAFTKEIAENRNSGVTYLTMAEQASGAVEYCYNRNKRKPDGSIAEVVWYLPSADELEDFIVPAYNSYKEFQDNYYWTSQPAYVRNVFYYEYFRLIGSDDTYAFIIYEDNTEYARATKIVRENGEFEPALSGLNPTPNPMVDNRAKRGETNATNLGYFYMMRYWKRDKWGGKEYGQDKKSIADAVIKGIDVTNGDYDEAFKDTKDGKRYYIHLGHLYNMIQKSDDGGHGYHHRTKSNRVRCVRKL